MLTGANATQPRAVTPTTEVSLIDTSEGPRRWWKLITLAGQSNYYRPDGSTFNGSNPCLAAAQPDPPQPGRTDPLVNGACPVCNATHPCLFDLLADSTEASNVASERADVVARLAPLVEALQTPYVPGHLPASTLAKDYVPINASEWGGFLGPCYRRQADQQVRIAQSAAGSIGSAFGRSLFTS